MGQPIGLDLNVEGPEVTGTISVDGQMIPVFRGTVNGNNMTFTFTTPDGNRTITVTGHLDGDSPPGVHAEPVPSAHASPSVDFILREDVA